MGLHQEDGNSNDRANKIENRRSTSTDRSRGRSESPAYKNVNDTGKLHSSSHPISPSRVRRSRRQLNFDSTDPGSSAVMSDIDTDEMVKESKVVELRMRQTAARCEDDRMGEEQMIVKGLYRLEGENLVVYNKFVEMLSTYDSHDMVQILQDAMREAQGTTLLDQYGGFVPESDVTPI